MAELPDPEFPDDVPDEVILWAVAKKTKRRRRRRLNTSVKTVGSSKKIKQNDDEDGD